MKAFGRWMVAAAVIVAALPASGGNSVDSGTFGVFVNGRRVATERFQIEGAGGANTTKSELLVEDGSNTASQTAEMQLSSTGELRRYEWRETTGSKSRMVVEPHESFLIQRVYASATAKEEQQPFLMPASTVVLDDHFFVHRQLLAWRYLAAECVSGEGPLKCKAGKVPYAVLNPRQRLSHSVTIEPAGREPVLIRGVSRELLRLNLQSEGVDWVLHLDDHYKLVRLAVPAEHIEVTRD